MYSILAIVEMLALQQIQVNGVSKMAKGFTYRAPKASMNMTDIFAFNRICTPQSSLIGIMPSVQSITALIDECAYVPAVITGIGKQWPDVLNVA